MSKHRSMAVLALSLILVLMLVLGCGSDSTTIATDNSKLSGEYVRLLLSDTMSSIGNMTFDGAGNFQVDQIYSTSSNAEQTNTTAGTYAVYSNGNFTFDSSAMVGSSTLEVEGAVLSDGIVYSGVRLNDIANKFFVAGVKPSASGVTAADITGDFHFAFLSFQSGTPYSAFGYITFNGAGGYSMTGVTSDTSTAGDPYSDTGTYAVTDNGRLTLTRGDDYIYNGAIASTGDVIVGSGVEDSTEQSSIICIKTGSGFTVANSAGSSRSSSIKSTATGTTTVLISTTFDGSGGFSFDGVATTDATIKADVSGPGTYTVNDLGAFEIISSGPMVNGAIRDGGKVSITMQEDTVEHRIGMAIRQ